MQYLDISMCRPYSAVRKAKGCALPTCLGICAGAGGQALGLHKAGFRHVALSEYEKAYGGMLLTNRPCWNVICCDVRDFDGAPYFGQVDLLAGGAPARPFP